MPLRSELEPEVVTTWRVTRSWKGVDEERVDVFSGMGIVGRCDPGPEFHVGDEGLVFLGRSDGKLYASRCLPRLLGRDATATASLLGTPRAPPCHPASRSATKLHGRWVVVCVFAAVLAVLFGTPRR